MPRELPGGVTGPRAGVAGGCVAATVVVVVSTTVVGEGAGAVVGDGVVVVEATGGANVVDGDVGVGAGDVVGDGVATVDEDAGTVTVVEGAGCGRLPGFGVVTTGLGSVGAGASVVGVDGTLVFGAFGSGIVVVGDGVAPRRGAGGTIVGLLAALASLPTNAVRSHRRGLLGTRSTAVSMRPSSFWVVDDSSNSISFSMGALLPSGSWRQVIL